MISVTYLAQPSSTPQAIFPVRRDYFYPKPIKSNEMSAMLIQQVVASASIQRGFYLERTLDGKEMLPLKDLTSLVIAFTLAMVIFHVVCYVMEKIRILVVRLMGWELVRRPRMRNQAHRVAEQARRRNRRLKQPEENEEPQD